MSTRVASIVGMIVGLAICVGGGILIANPPLGILGAVVLTLGAILFSVASTWAFKKTWGRMPGQDISTPSTEKLYRVSRWLIIGSAAVTAAGIGLGAFQLAEGQAPTGFFWAAFSAIQVGSNISSRKKLRERVENDDQ